MGKNVGDDLAEGKCTLPLIYAMKHGNEDQSEIIKNAIIHKSSDSIEKIISIVKDTGSLEHTKNLATRYSEKALSCIPTNTENNHKHAMQKLAQLAVARKA